MKIVCIIPARLASSRFPMKVLEKISNIPMIEYVRRKAIMTNIFSEIFVATCDKEISNIVKQFSGKVIITSKEHNSGTSRISEAVSKIDCTHAFLLQGDEPLVDPEDINSMCLKVNKNPKIEILNSFSNIENDKELKDKSIVKGIIDLNSKFKFFFRGNPFLASKNLYLDNVKIIQGLMIFKKEILLNFNKLNKIDLELQEKIEQLGTLINGIDIIGYNQKHYWPSVNTPKDLKQVKKIISQNSYQNQLDKIIRNYKSV